MAGLLNLVLALSQCSSGQRYCCSAECLRTADMIAENMHQTPRTNLACEDFYEYACQNFQNTHPYPPIQLLDDSKLELDQEIADLLSQEDDNAPDAIQVARIAYTQCITNADENASSSHAPTSSQLPCVDAIKNQFPRVVLRLLANEDAWANRTKVLEMTGFLKASFANIIDVSTWLHPNIKATAKRKISTIRGMVSFSEDLISDENLLKPLQATIDVFGKGSGYAPDRHSIFVPISAVRFPRYNLGLEVLNFAALGFEISHEISHMFDEDGRQRGVDGKFSSWWTREMENTYRSRARCFVEQYSRFEMPDIGARVDGQRTLTENIQDNVGFRIAFDAYRLYRAEHGNEMRLRKLKHFNHDKLSTLTYANIFCQNVTPEYDQYVIQNDNHAPVRFRVNGTLMNSKEFAKIWKCPPNAPMNPGHKCNIWLDDDEDDHHHHSDDE